MIALLLLPGQAPKPVDVLDRNHIQRMIGADHLETRPYTLSGSQLIVAMDEDFVRKGLPDNIAHPTYRVRYVLQGPLVVFRENEAERIVSMTPDDVERAIAIWERYRILGRNQRQGHRR